MITNTTATLDQLQALADPHNPTPVRLWRDAGRGGGRAPLHLDGVLRKATWLPEHEEFGVHIQGLRGEYSTYVSLPPWHPWTITPLCGEGGCDAERDAFGCTGDGYHAEVPG